MSLCMSLFMSMHVIIAYAFYVISAFVRDILMYGSLGFSPGIIHV